MGDGSMTTLTIADPEKPGIADFLMSLPSRSAILPGFDLISQMTSHNRHSYIQTYPQPSKTGSQEPGQGQEQPRHPGLPTEWGGGKVWKNKVVRFNVSISQSVSVILSVRHASS